MFEKSRRRIPMILDHALPLTQIEVEGEKLASECVPLAAILTAAIEGARLSSLSLDR